MKHTKILLLTTCLTLNATVLASVNIVQRTPLRFGTLNPLRGGTSRINTDLCISGNTTSYQLTLTNEDGSKRPFFLVMQNKRIPIQVYWNNKSGTNGNHPIQPNLPITFSNVSARRGCPDGDNANIEVVVNARDFKYASAGRAAVNLRITVSEN